MLEMFETLTAAKKQAVTTINVQKKFSSTDILVSCLNTSISSASFAGKIHRGQHTINEKDKAKKASIM